jgi:glycerol-3-phosphate acyltransferase PlsY
MIVALVVLGYLLGSIPVAWILARVVTGQDLRQLGSGNVGVMNTALSVARWAGLLVFLAEAAKGVLAVILARMLGGGEAQAPWAGEITIALTVLAAVAGTRWAIWLRGAGGRGNTAGVAAVLLLSWPTVVAGLAAWALLRVLSRRSFVATRGVLVLWPIAFGLFTRSWVYGVFGAALSLMYLSTQHPETDDHLIIKERWPNLWAFLSGPRRT